MTEKEKLLSALVQKTQKTQVELERLVQNKINELSGLVSAEGAIYILANEFGVRLDVEKPKKEANTVKIEQIKEPKMSVSVTVKILRKYDKVQFSSAQGSSGSVQSLLVGDETGVTRVVFWNDKTELVDTMNEGDILQLHNVYSRQNNNSERMEVHYGQYSALEVNPPGIKIEVKPLAGAEQISYVEKKISELEVGERNVRIKGLVTDFDVPRFYLGCPQCFKKVFQDEGVSKCSEHGQVKEVKVPIVQMIVDDGQSTIAVVGFRDRAEKLTNLTGSEIVFLTEQLGKYRLFSKRISGATIELAGNVSANNVTGDKQLLVNAVFKLQLKPQSAEYAEEEREIPEVEEKPKKSSKKEEPKKEAKKVESNDESSSSDNIDIDIEEITIDEDIL